MSNVVNLSYTVADKLKFFCSPRNIARQASAQICAFRLSGVAGEFPGANFDPIFVEIFRFCILTDFSRNYCPHYDIFLILFSMIL